MKNSNNKIHYYDFGEFRLDISNRELLKNGKHIPLTQKSFELLEFLIQNRGRSLRKNEILNGIWTDSFVEEANLAQHIYMIRKVLKNGDDNNKKYIETIPKYGYRFVGEVNEEFEDISAKPKIKETSESSTDDKISLQKEALEKSADEKDSSLTKDESIPPAKQVPRQKIDTKWVIGGIIGFILLSSLVYFIFKFQNNSAESNIKSIAILPFNQISDQPDDKLGLGIADTLISKLGNQNEISISPTSSVIGFTADNKDNPIAIGEKLNVDAVLTGTIQRDGEMVRVNVQLINVKEKTPKWSDKFDAKFSDIFSLQDKIADKIAQKLSLKLNPQPPPQSSNEFTENIEAYQAYTMGLFYWDKRTYKNLPKAIEHFEKAFQNDPEFAPAYAFAADSYALIAYQRYDLMPENTAVKKARELANKAIELNPKSSEAYSALGIIATHERNDTEARMLFRKATELKPNNATARQRLAWFLATKGSLNEAVSEMRLAQKTSPTAFDTNISLARLLRLNNQPDEALIFCKRVIELDDSLVSPRLLLAQIYEQKKDYDMAIKEIELLLKKIPNYTYGKIILSRIAAKKGDKTESRKLLNEILQTDTQSLSYELATIYWFLGEKNKAIETLKKEKEIDFFRYLLLKYDPIIDEMRKLPEFKQILENSKKLLEESNK